MKGIVCSVCGFIALDGKTPEHCPVCHAPAKMFKEQESAIVTPSAATDKLEANKKHVPVISINKQCGLIAGGCVDVHVKVGEVTHPMTLEHSIQYIDCYINKVFVARVHLTPEKLNPAIGLHLKVSSGTFSAIEKCNLHGAWLSETNI